jgi:hypothetical protein
MGVSVPKGGNAFWLGVVAGVAALLLLNKFAPQIKAKIPIVKSA